MNRPPSLRRLLLGAFALACALYLAGFTLDQHLRSRRGPWEVRFEPAPDGGSQLRIHHPHLGLTNPCLLSPPHTFSNAPATVRFLTPHQTIPLGRVVYDDLTYLPGVVTLEIFGHEIELLPRTLYLDRQPVAWTNTTPLVVPN